VALADQTAGVCGRRDSLKPTKAADQGHAKANLQTNVMYGSESGN
jgi:hypothetical protein